MNAPLIDKPEAGAAPVVPGRFITFEGGEGAGKSTQARHLRAHLEQAGVGSVSEVFDGLAPYQPGGCIAQAWSVAELLRASVEDV